MAAANATTASAAEVPTGTALTPAAQWAAKKAQQLAKAQQLRAARAEKPFGGASSDDFLARLQGAEQRDDALRRCLDLLEYRAS